MSPEVSSNSRKQRFLAVASRHGHTRTLQPLSAPPRLLCRPPGPGPSVARLSHPRPHLPWVCKLTPARDATERARDCLRWTPSEAIARAFRRSLSAPPTVKCPDPQPSCTRRIDAVIICRPCLPKFRAIAANNAFWQLHRDTVTRGRSSLSAHHLAFSVALLAQARQ